MNTFEKAFRILKGILKEWFLIWFVGHRTLNWFSLWRKRLTKVYDTAVSHVCADQFFERANFPFKFFYFKKLFTGSFWQTATLSMEIAGDGIRRYQALWSDFKRFYQNGYYRVNTIEWIWKCGYHQNGYSYWIVQDRIRRSNRPSNRRTVERMTILNLPLNSSITGRWTFECVHVQRLYTIKCLLKTIPNQIKGFILKHSKILNRSI